MSSPLLLSRREISLFIAVSALALGISGSDADPAPPESAPEAPRPSVEQRETGVKTESSGRDEKTAGPTQAAGERRETAQRDELLILLLQILRSSK